MEQLLNFSKITIYTVILLAIGLFIFFRFLTWLVPILALKRNKRKQAWRYTALVELFMWIAFLIWSVNYLSESSPIYALGLFIMLFFFTFFTAWVALKDFIFGAIFKTNTHFKINETIKIGDYSGKIIKFKPSGMILETESGEAIFLPYSTLSGKAIIKSNPAETILSHTFRVEIPKTNKLTATIRNIYDDIIIMPWASLKKSPQIKPLMETKAGQLLEVTIFAIEKDYFLEMENMIKLKYENNHEDDQ
jgi:hypothetical protein